MYLLRLREDDAQLDTWNDQYYGAGESLLDSDYQATNAALYGSLEMRAGQHGTLTLGLRYEQRTADYADSSDAPFPRARDRMPGGNLSWLWDARRATPVLRDAVARLQGRRLQHRRARSIRPQRRFRAETLWNLEVGVRAHSLRRRGVDAGRCVRDASRIDAGVQFAPAAAGQSA